MSVPTKTSDINEVALTSAEQLGGSQALGHVDAHVLAPRAAPRSSAALATRSCTIFIVSGSPFD